MDEAMRKQLLQLGWKESVRYLATNRWHFFEIRNFNVLRVICLVEESHSSKDEVERIKTCSVNFPGVKAVGWFKRPEIAPPFGWCGL